MLLGSENVPIGFVRSLNKMSAEPQVTDIWSCQNSHHAWQKAPHKNDLTDRLIDRHIDRQTAGESDRQIRGYYLADIINV